MRVFRIQDCEGRGPFRPGFTQNWSSPDFEDGVASLPTWGQEFGHDLIVRRGLPGERYGTAVRKPQDLSKWFSKAERERLSALGFNAVSLKADRILAESRNQLVFARRAPLNTGTVLVPWEAIR